MNATLFTRWEPDPVGRMLGTGFNRFESVAGVDGLAKDNGHGMIELLAVHSRVKGKGQFRRFIALLKEQNQTICVWHVDNPMLGPALLRYGFKPETTIDGFGETLTGYRWDRTL